MSDERFLIVFRHGKSDRDNPHPRDHARELKERGRENARQMGGFLARARQVPRLVLSSTAVRARTTAELAASAGEWEAELRFLDDLYDRPLARVIEVLAAGMEEAGSVMMVGHEPTCSALIAHLVGGKPPPFPTAAMARVDSGPDGLRAGAGVLRWFVLPKLLEAR